MTGGRFEPKEPVQLAPPKDDPITVEELAKNNGEDDKNTRRKGQKLTAFRC